MIGNGQGGIVIGGRNAILSPIESLNAASSTLMYGYRFVAEGPVLQNFWLNINAIYGTNANISLTIELRTDDGNGVPTDTVLGTTSQTGGWAISQQKFTPSWSGITLTVGTAYWIILKNESTNPTVDYLQFCRVNWYSTGASYSSVRYWGKRQYNGSNWTTSTGYDAFTALAVKYNNGIVAGAIVHKGSTYNSSWLSSATRRVGVETTAQTTMQIAALELYITGTSSTVFTALSLYVNRVKIASTPVMYVVSPAMRTGALPYPVTVNAGDKIAIMSDAVDMSSADAQGMYVTDDPDLNLLRPFGNGWYAVKLENETTWTEDRTKYPLGAFLLDITNPFPAAPLNRRQFNNQR